MTDLEPWVYDAHTVRLITGDDGEPWFVLTDVCRILDLNNTSQVAERIHDPHKGYRDVDTPGGPQRMIVVDELGLSRAVFLSRKPEAERFQLWALGKLKDLRRHGVAFADDDAAGTRAAAYRGTLDIAALADALRDLLGVTALEATVSELADGPDTISEKDAIRMGWISVSAFAESRGMFDLDLGEQTKLGKMCREEAIRRGLYRSAGSRVWPRDILELKWDPFTVWVVAKRKAKTEADAIRILKSGFGLFTGGDEND